MSALVDGAVRPDLAALTARRRAMLAAALDGTDQGGLEIVGMELAVGGNSRETWIAELAAAGERRRLVLRCDPDHWIRPVEMRREINGLRLAELADVPAPRILVCSDDVELDRPYVVIDHVEGTAIARRILRDEAYARARDCFATQAGEILARLHSASAHAEGWECRDALADVREHLANVQYPSPTLEGGLVGLERNRPDPPAVLAPVHGDFRIGNLMVAADGITAVLDWETCHACDPYEDLGWVSSRAWRYGGEQPVGGIGSMEDLLGAYAAGTGKPIDAERLHWWTVYGLVSWGIVCNRVRAPGAPGDVLEGGAVGRQVCQQEYNVLLELERYVGR